MSPGGRKIAATAGVLGALAVAVVATLALLAGRRAALPGAPGPRDRDRAAAEAPGAPAPAPGAPGVRPGEDGPVVSREESGSGPLEGGEAETAALARALLPHLARQNVVRAAVAEAREGHLHPVDLEIRLREAAGGDPRAGAAILDELIAERKPEVALKLAQVLATLLDDGPLRKATVDALAAADPVAREVGLLALLGRGEPEVAALAARSFLDDAPAARATAAFLLNNGPGGRTAPQPADILEAARAVLRDPSGTPSRLREEALALIGRPWATDADLALIERTLADGPEPAVKARAFEALVTTGAPRARTRPALERALDDPGLPGPVKEAIRGWLRSAP